MPEGNAASYFVMNLLNPINMNGLVFFHALDLKHLQMFFFLFFVKDACKQHFTFIPCHLRIFTFAVYSIKVQANWNSSMTLQV